MIRNKRNLLIAAGLLLSTASWGQEAARASFLDNNFQDIVLLLLIIIMVVFVIGSLTIFRGFMNLMIDQLPADKRAKYIKSGGGIVNWEKLNRRLTDAVPIEQERDIMLDHEYDGIRELDNHLPPWWKWLFYATIVFAVVYISHHYVFKTGMDQYEIYEKKVAEAEIAKAAYLSTLADNVDESNVTMLTDPGKLAEGKEIFLAKCTPCHGQLAEGNTIGPNLTDEYWIHGGDIKTVFTTVKYGIANKMIPWGDQLLPGEMNNVSSYVLSLQGSNPPNAKDAQGDLYVQPAVDADAPTEGDASEAGGAEEVESVGADAADAGA